MNLPAAQEVPVPAMRFLLMPIRSNKQGVQINVGKDGDEYNAIVNTMQMRPEDMKELGAASGLAASRMFLEGMIKHHEGAVEMAQAEISDGKNPDAITLAKAIATSQEQEITVMKNLLNQI